MGNLTSEEMDLAIKSACRHYISISYYVGSPEIFAANNGLVQTCVCSAFLMRVGDAYCLVTAGHVLDGIEKERERYELTAFRLWDGWVSERQDQHHIPFDYWGALKAHVCRDGLDYGLILLGANTSALLLANGTSPIREEQYQRDWPPSFDGYAMIGTPSSSVALRQTGERTVTIKQSLVGIYLEPEANPPAELRLAASRFYARIIAPKDTLLWQSINGDIQGMSGGPIIGIRREGGLRYWVIAIQSGWLPESRIIAGCYFQQFARGVAAELGSMQATMEERQRGH